MSESNLPLPEDGAIMASRRTKLLGLVVVNDVVVGENREENKQVWCCQGTRLVDDTNNALARDSPQPTYSALPHKSYIN